MHTALFTAAATRFVQSCNLHCNTSALHFLHLVGHTTGFGDILMLALPHHVEMMDSSLAEYALPQAYQTIKVA